jgi:hypothetical protein
MKYKNFELTEFERVPGKWRVAIKRVDGATVQSKEVAFGQVITYGDTLTADLSIQEAKKLVDKGTIE